MNQDGCSAIITPTVHCQWYMNASLLLNRIMIGVGHYVNENYLKWIAIYEGRYYTNAGGVAQSSNVIIL